MAEIWIHGKITNGGKKAIRAEIYSIAKDASVAMLL